MIMVVSVLLVNRCAAVVADGRFLAAPVGLSFDVHLRNAKLQLSAVLAPGDEVPGLYLHPDHRRRLRRAPVRSDISV